jgi:superoxide dismutase, Fe-Mn family
MTDGILRKGETCNYAARNFEHLIGTEGFSRELLTNHFTLYEGYVKNTNLLAETLLSLVKRGDTGIPEYAELHRRFGWEFNGMRLHEYYFENMTKKRRELKKDSEFYKQRAQECPRGASSLFSDPITGA